MVAEAVKAFEALAPVANPMKRLTRSATGRRKWWRSARSVIFSLAVAASDSRFQVAKLPRVPTMHAELPT